MAESTTNQNSKFFCHSCNVEIESVSLEFTCPLCGGGFIEELLPPSPNDAYQSQTDSSSDETNDFSSAFRLASSLISPLLFSTTGARPAATEIGSTMLPGNQPIAEGGPHAASTTTARPLRRPRGRYGMQTVTNFDNILQDILMSVTNDGGNGTGAAGGTPLFFMGNPGDYAWGREGLDTIVTQLLNQMDNTGPPPLEKDKIKEIPKVEVLQEQLDSQLQCSVCWEDFQLHEIVRKLPCDHIYHENCIVPWLELHGTCPICRKLLMPENTDDQRNSFRSVANSLTSHLRNIRPDNNDTTLANGGNATASSQSANQQSPQMADANESMFNPFFGPPQQQSSPQININFTVGGRGRYVNQHPFETFFDVEMPSSPSSSNSTRNNDTTMNSTSSSSQQSSNGRNDRRDDELDFDVE